MKRQESPVEDAIRWVWEHINYQSAPREDEQAIMSLRAQFKVTENDIEAYQAYMDGLQRNPEGFGEPDSPAMKAIEDAERNWQVYLNQRKGCK